VSPDHLAGFQEHGYVVLRGLLDDTDLAPVRREYEGVLARLAADLHERGEVPSTFADLPFAERVAAIYAASGRAHAQAFDFSLPLGAVEEDTPMWVGPEVFALLRNTKILDAVEPIIGSEIYSNPIQHVRIKPPESAVPRHLSTSATTWHQDQGVTLPEADDTEMVTVWFGLTHATEENGCLHVRPGSHLAGLLPHCPTERGPAIPDRLLPTAYQTLPMEPGDVLLMHRRTCHGSLPNRSDELRWSFDLRYQPVGQPTGRGVFPGFVARSRQDPGSELRDPQSWSAMWHRTRTELIGAPPVRAWRWEADEELCA
jgi:phytanoyl-CoA hydroxylase